MTAEKNAYAILGITKGSTEKEVKTAYVNLVKKYDPEKHTDRFMIIQQAYDRLRQTKSRANEDLYTLNMATGAYLFQDDEKWDKTDAPDEAEFDRLRAEFREKPMDEERKAAFIRSLFQRAHFFTRRKQYSEAIRTWSEVLEHDPSNARARHNLELACATLGISYALHGLSEESIELHERALQINPDNTDLVHNLALVAEQARDAERAVRYWQEAVARWKVRLKEQPDDEYLRLLIVEALNHQTDLNEEQWMRRAQRSSAARQTSAVSSSKESTPRLDGATAGPKTSGTNHKSDPRAMPSKTEVEKPAFDVSSIDRFREIVELNPDDYDAHFQLCNKLYESQLYAEAQEELQRLLKKNPRNTEVWNLLGWAMLNNNQKDQGFACWKRSLSIDPKNPVTREHLVRAHLMMGKAFRTKGIFTQALVHFKQLISLMPKSAEVHLEIAATYDMKGDVRSAMAEYEQVLKLDPKNKVARKAINDLRMKR